MMNGYLQNPAKTLQTYKQDSCLGSQASRSCITDIQLRLQRCNVLRRSQMGLLLCNFKLTEFCSTVRSAGGIRIINHNTG
jgi:hypothetical protein